MDKMRLPSGIYLLKVNIRNAKARCEICSKVTIKTLELRTRFMPPSILLISACCDFYAYIVVINGCHIITHS